MKQLPISLRLSGEDPQIILNAESEAQRRFRRIGWMVLVVVLCSAAAGVAFLAELFDGSLPIAILFGIGWAGLMLNLYLLLLSSISPAIISSKDIRHKLRTVIQNRKELTIFVSLAIRILFIGFLGLAIAQPLQLEATWLLHRNQVIDYTYAKKTFQIAVHELEDLRNIWVSERDLASDAQQWITLTANTNEIQQARATEIYLEARQDSLIAEQLEQKLRNVGRPSPEIMLSLAPTLERLLAQADSNRSRATREALAAGIDADEGSPFTRWSQLEQQRAKNLDTWLSVIDKDNLLVYRIGIGYRFPTAWLLTMLTVFLFVWPIFRKYSIRNKTKFYRLKEKMEQQLIEEEYQTFKKQYAAIFREHYQQGIIITPSVVFYESHVDPPFNLQPIKESFVGGDEQQLLNLIYQRPLAEDDQKELVSEETEIE